MHVMLAEDIGGWLFAGGVLFGGFALSVLALAALFPASKGNRAVTLALAGPAFLLGVIVTVWLVYDHVGYIPPDPTYNPTPEFVTNLIVMAGAPLVTGLLAIIVLWYRRVAKRDA